MIRNKTFSWSVFLHAIPDGSSLNFPSWCMLVNKIKWRKCEGGKRAEAECNSINQSRYFCESSQVFLHQNCYILLIAWLQWVAWWFNNPKEFYIMSTVIKVIQLKLLFVWIHYLKFCLLKPHQDFISCIVVDNYEKNVKLYK